MFKSKVFFLFYLVKSWVNRWLSWFFTYYSSSLVVLRNLLSLLDSLDYFKWCEEQSCNDDSHHYKDNEVVEEIGWTRVFILTVCSRVAFATLTGSILTNSSVLTLACALFYFSVYDLNVCAKMHLSNLGRPFPLQNAGVTGEVSWEFHFLTFQRRFFSPTSEFTLLARTFI